MVKFRSAFDLGEEEFVTPAGSQEFPVFQFDSKSGELVEVGKTNVYDKIQSFKDDCLLVNILKRCASTGEVLIAPKERFIDTTVLPKDLLEVQQQKNLTESFVNSLSEADQQILFEQGFDSLLSAKIAAFEKSKSIDESKKEVKDNE